MPFQPINYGNILAQNEQIRGQQTQNALAARQFDPNSLDNRYKQAQILKMQREAAGGGVGVGDLSPKDATFPSIQKFLQTGNYNDLERYNKPAAPFRIDAGDVWKVYVNNPLTGQPELVETIPKNLAPNEELDYIGGAAQAREQGALFGQSGQPYVSAEDIDLGVTVAPTKASVEGEVARAKAQQTEIGRHEGGLEANRTKTDVMMAEAFGKNEMIGGQLANARRLAGPLTVGWAGQKLADLAGSEANDLRLELQSIRSNAGLDTIRDMKAAGGTVGQVTEAEWPKLESKYAALEQSGSLKEFLRRLDEFEKQYAQSLTRLQAAYKQDYNESFNFKKFMAQGGDTGGGLEGGGLKEIKSQAEYDALPSGAEYTEDGVKYRKP